MNPKTLQTLEFHKIIYKLERHAATSLGKAAAQELEPSTDLEEVKLRLQATDQAALVERLKGPPPFGGIKDIREALSRARIGAMLHPQELLDTANTIYGSLRLKKFLLAVGEEQSIGLLTDIAKRIPDLQSLEKRIKSCIDDAGDVMDSASPDLARIRQEMRAGEGRVRERLEQYIRNSSTQKMLQESIITLRNNRYVIPVKQEYRSHFGGMIHDQSASGATLFIEPEAIVQLNNRLRELRLKEEKEIEKILRMLTSEVAEQADELADTVDACGVLDFIFAKAGLAHEMKASLPIMNDRGFLKLKRSRHPLIPADEVVPIDVELGNTFKTIIVTGPNTGGKTVSLKTIGLLSLMSMSGLFIPAEDGSQMCVFDGIYADIGDEQSIEQSLSTFSSHLTNIIRILKEITPKSLVLLDELGAGTDPAEGSALAIAMLEYIRRIGCRMVATTHYSELKAYAYERKDIINASMEFNVQTLSPTYRLMIGVPGRSNAFAIAERLGLPKPIIDQARGQIKEEDQQVEHMIASLEANRISAEEERDKAEQLRREVEQLRKRLSEEKAKFEQQKDKLLQKAEQEAQQAVEQARKEADQIISELRRLAMEERSSIKEHKLIEAKRALEEARPKLRDQATAKPRAGAKQAKVEPGDEVQVISLGQKAHVVELVGHAEAMVQVGIMKIKVALSDLELIQQKPEPVKQKAAAGLKRTKGDQVRTELDLRGSSLEEALVEVDRFLDEAFLANLGQVYIIHGKGTGVLRNGITDFLRKHKHVKSYRLGQFGEGGSGVTVAELN
ncbi:endonuclease MutS2 [Xylanibacillus composti]|uniref:Endonuclease MutS2 n=1 Tax=Xylanibacillus composti TaxID=1572762 RepID=A0A8J4H516_9BACL|nr:endonuclease MutS2 [Xylanibacillus composti]MDT9724678.1 endonuclease MutS2 [Xylanibacillus composti]GIQ70964.1 endonuclease MutS2 [Xylanibacillus composti]